MAKRMWQRPPIHVRLYLALDGTDACINDALALAEPDSAAKLACGKNSNDGENGYEDRRDRSSGEETATHAG